MNLADFDFDPPMDLQVASARFVATCVRFCDAVAHVSALPGDESVLPADQSWLRRADELAFSKEQPAAYGHAEL